LSKENLISENAHRIPSLDGFRALAILMVIIHHAFDEPSSVFSGNFGVSVFFVISGYLITTLLLEEKNRFGDISLKNFYLRRVLRIFPVAYLFLVVLAFMNVVFSLDIPWPSFVSAGLYIHNTNLIEGYNWYNGHYWSLSVEEQYYLIFPFLLQRSTRLFTIVSFCTLMLIPVVNLAFARGYFHGGFPQFICEVLKNMSGPLVGSLLAVAVFYNRIGFKIPDQYKSILSVSLFVIAAVLSTNLVITVPTMVSQLFIAPLILLNVTSYNGFVYRFLNWKPLMAIGVLSYSLYIWQQMFTDNVPWAGIYPGVMDSVWLNLGLLALVSYASYTFFERPLVGLRKRLSRSASVK
jgi:peptidoglycan/LPS O-acetylase OafA/YrhL